MSAHSSQAVRHATARVEGAALRRLASDLDHIGRICQLSPTLRAALRISAGELRGEADRREQDAAAAVTMAEAFVAELPQPAAV